MIDSHRMRRIASSCVLAFVVSSFAACGGGGGGSDDDGGSSGGGANSGGDSSNNPTAARGLDANGNIVDPGPSAPNVYQKPEDNGQPIEIELTIHKADPNGACRGDDPDTPDIDEEDYSGCTLADLNGGQDPDDRGDTDSDDAFDPELSATVYIPKYDQTFESVGGMEVRGSSTRQTKQKSYKIEFSDGKWFGMDRLLLNKNPYDLTRIRDKLAFDLFRQVDDITSLRTQFVRLYVTDENHPERKRQDFGLFTNLEQVGVDWAKNHGQEPDSDILFPNQFTFQSPQTTPGLKGDPFSDAFTRIIVFGGKNHDPEVLLDMLNAVNDEGQDFDTTFRTYFHPDNFRTWLALNILISNYDTNSQNFDLYRPDEITQFYFLPWDYDSAWDFYGQPDQKAAGSNLPRWQHGLSNWWHMKLVKRYIKNGGVPALTAKMDALRSGPVSKQSVKELIGRYPDADRIVASPVDRNQLPLDNTSSKSAAEQVRDEINRLPQTIDTSYQQYKQTLERPMPMYLSAVADGGSLRLVWDESYDIQGDAIVYDVRLAKSPIRGGLDDACTDEDEAMPMLDTDVVYQKQGIKGTAVVPDVQITPGRYYLQVVARDDNGYCQGNSEGFYSEDDERTYYGALRFEYDGSGITYP